jgi:hypothetical protein
MRFLTRAWISFAIGVPLIAAPMTFKASGLFQVFADGEITADTPGAFTDFVKRQLGTFPMTVMFNSPGGDLIAGLSLGREIRRAGWSTSIGTPGLSEFLSKLGECDSACTLAFLGGRARTISGDSKYGVHRFWGKVEGDTQQETQKIAGELVAYIREMGVSAEMYTLMTQGAPEQVKYLDSETMARVRITTKEVVQVNLADENGVSVVHLTDQDSGGTVYGHMDFYCNRQRLLARAYFLTPVNPTRYTLSWLSSSANLAAERQVTIPQTEYRLRGQDANQIWIDINVTHALLQDWILPATSIAVKLAQIPGTPWDVMQDRVGSVLTPLPSAFRTFAQTMERSCH